MEQLFGELFGLALFLFLLGLGWGVGRMVEAAHVRRLAQDEAELAVITHVNTRHLPPNWHVTRACLVQGQAVISSDYFKTFLSYLRGIFGGELRAIETVMRRARREAMVRMLREAQRSGANAVWNVRLDTSNIVQGTGSRRGMIAAEILAYGTALRVEGERPSAPPQ